MTKHTDGVRARGDGGVSVRLVSVAAAAAALLCLGGALTAGHAVLRRLSERAPEALALVEGPHRWMVWLTAALALLVLALAAACLLLLGPMRRGVARVRARQPLALEGPAEYRALAAAYNLALEENRRSSARLTYDAMHDALTGLYNRSAYERVLESLSDAAMTLILLDVDHFKVINDTRGHAAGDMVLRRIAELLRESFRTEDYICRIGGDEFAVILTHVGTAQRSAMEKKLGRLRQRLAEPTDEPVSVSMGVAFGDRDNGTDSIFKDADAALYRVKNSGRDGFAFY